MRLVTRIRRLLRRMIDAAARRTYEGPPVPARLSDELLVWVAINPDASRERLTAYAIRLIEAAYTDGFTRGYTWGVAGDKPGEGVPDAALHTYQRGPLTVRVLADGRDRNDALSALSKEERAIIVRALTKGGRIQ